MSLKKGFGREIEDWYFGFSKAKKRVQGGAG